LIKEFEIFILDNQRRLGYAEYGDPNGKPVFYFHGFPGSRLEGRSLADAALKAGVHLITTDRPGYGLSDFQRERVMLDWPWDIVRLADGLGIEHFAILGHSGGGPYTLSCAYALPERVSRAAIVAGLGPLGAPGVMRGADPFTHLSFWSIRRAFWLAALGVCVMNLSVHLNAKLSQRVLILGMHSPDRDLYANHPEIRANEVEIAHQVFSQGVRGPIHDLSLYRNWGFSLAHIRRTVQFWQGEQDSLVPPEMARWQANHIQNSQVRMLSKEGHYTILRNYGEQILRELIER